MVEEEPRKTFGKNHPPMKSYFHIPTLAESATRTHADRDEMAVIRNEEHFRPLGHSEPPYSFAINLTGAG